jgi:hypothetical protein
MKMPESFKTEQIPPVLPVSFKPVNDGMRIRTLLFYPANDNMKHTSVQSKGSYNIFAQARAVKRATERLRHLLILNFLGGLGPR